MICYTNFSNRIYIETSEFINHSQTSRTSVFMVPTRLHELLVVYLNLLLKMIQINNSIYHFRSVTTMGSEHTVMIIHFGTIQTTRSWIFKGLDRLSIIYSPSRELYLEISSSKVEIGELAIWFSRKPKALTRNLSWI